jgi:hypothetical protein
MKEPNFTMVTSRRFLAQRLHEIPPSSPSHLCFEALQDAQALERGVRRSSLSSLLAIWAVENLEGRASKLLPNAFKFMVN